MNSLTLTFIDLHGQFSKSIQKHLNPLKNLFNDIRIYQGDILDFDQKHQEQTGLAYLSPTNCLGFMDGGIDLVYSRKIFPGIEAQVKENIKQINHRNLIDRPYLPIGSALLTLTNRSQQYLISAPTMWLPQNVSKTKNAKYAFLGTLWLINFWNFSHPQKQITELVCPGLGTGYGKMTHDQSAQQIREAILELGSTKLTTQEWKYFEKYHVYFKDDPEIVQEQPDYYQNTEWKNIDITKIKKVD